MDKKIKQEILESLKKVFEKMQLLPHQFVVVYLRKSDDSLIGYHMSTWCNYTEDILEAKRFSAENPYPQLATISKNLKHILVGDLNESDPFGKMMKAIRDNQWNGVHPDDIYLDAIYLAEGTPPQDFRMTIIDGEQFREF